ncbi:C-type lectin domain family 1 member B-like isoform X1 [Hypanus sabinus]|uniref:C-type lectin domain family 1 member B-like isoform X1 n=1 Tax=Hypanus sabinus TaxID=79690 RepID=UPI0028C3FE61|nr:C-type lectin domain family 1 member B-like isoform X1 [Hypanus sabinus]XP_059817584.1 C-type lectin domain family 1 member B-like isoform X1 [Hypanus sabinus]
MRGSKGGSPRGHRQRKDQQAEAYEEESELPDMVMEIEDDVLEEYNESKGTYQDKNQRLAKALALLGLLVCLILLGLMVYFGVTYEKMRRRLRQAGVGLQETTERYLKMQQNARLQEEQYCGHFRNSTQHWLQLFCEKYECPTRICDPGWILFGRSCFLFSNVSQSWEQSGEACIQLQGYLAIISSKKMQKFLLEHRRESIYWIGLTDKVTEGSWVWVDGTKVADGVMQHLPDSSLLLCGKIFFFAPTPSPTFQLNPLTSCAYCATRGDSHYLPPNPFTFLHVGTCIRSPLGLL